VARLYKRREKITIPHEALNAVSCNGSNEVVTIVKAGRERFVDNDMLSCFRSPDGEVAVAFGLRADDHKVTVCKSLLYITVVGDVMLIRKNLVAVMSPLGPIGVIGNCYELEAGMSCHGVGQVVVLDDAQDEGAVNVIRHQLPRLQF
jgi:hypothetical protein